MHISDPNPPNPDERPLLARIGMAVAAIGSASCPLRLTEVLRATAGYSYTVIFGYSGPVRPIDLYDDFPPAKRRIFVTDYQAGPYLLDPFYLAATQGTASGLHRMRDLAPDRFFQGEYFRNYYVKTGLAEEIAFFVDVGGGATVVLSLMRADKPFTAREFRALEAFCPLVQAIVTQHWGGIASRFEEPAPPGFGRQIEQSFLDFGTGILTAREREIVEFTLKGHSADAVGRLLGISSGTVRIHRRNIYSKLQINSQGELFSRFISTLTAGGEGA